MVRYQLYVYAKMKSETFRELSWISWYIKLTWSSYLKTTKYQTANFQIELEITSTYNGTQRGRNGVSV